MAVSPALRDSAWLALLERQTMLRCQSGTSAPVYCQYPLGMGLVLSRFLTDPNGTRGSFLAHQLVLDEDEDLNAFSLMRPVKPDIFLSAYAGSEGSVDPLPTLKIESAADPDQLSAGFRLLDGWFDRAGLAGLIAALSDAARDKSHSVHIVIDCDPAQVSETGRLLMDMLMRALPDRTVRNISYCTLLAPGETGLQYTVYISPRESAAQRRDAAAGLYTAGIGHGGVVWSPDAPVPDEMCVSLAEALLAHDLNWVDRLRHGGSGKRTVPASAHRPDVPPFEPGMDFTRYCEDFIDALKDRREALNDTAFETVARTLWPRFTQQIIHAADLIPAGDYTGLLQKAIVCFCRGRLGEDLGMSRQDLNDMIVILLDSVVWDEIELSDPETAHAVRAAAGYADYLEEGAFDESRLTALKIVSAMLDSSSASLIQVWDKLVSLTEENKALTGQVQACARRLVTERCRAAKVARNGLPLADDRFVNAAVVGYVRFSEGIPDFRAIDRVRTTVSQIGGAKILKRFEARFDRIRHGLHASRANMARHREMRFMLGVSLGLAVIIAGVIAAYFLFVK